MTEREPVTTAGVIAMANLEVRIGGYVSRAGGGRLTVRERVELVELIALRGQVLGSIADLELAARLTDGLVDQVPSDARSFLARARMRGIFHRFGSALSDLDTAAGLGGDSVALEAERAALYQALGRYDEALEIRRPAANTDPDFSSLAALAVLHGERGELDQAECHFTAAIRRYRGTSPFPLAMLELQRGRLWIENDDHRRARAWIASAAGCGSRTTITAVPAPGSPARYAGCPSTSLRRDTWPSSTPTKGRPRRRSPAFGRWRSGPTIPDTRHSSPAA